MNDLPLAEILERQHGVISRRQFLALDGSTASDIQRMLRRREWARLLPGVYLNHTGPPSWIQRAWGGVAHYWPAALDGDSAVRALVGPGWRAHDDRADIRIAVGPERRLDPVPGYRLRRVSGFDRRVQWHKDPPRIRFEDAVLDLAARSGRTVELVGILTDACQSRRTTPGRLLDVAAMRSRLPQRDAIVRVLADVRDGSCSVLEHGYLNRVERPHHLPRGTRQRVGLVHGRRMFTDVEYVDQGLVVELDGRLFHSSTRQRDLDLERDLATAVDRRDTVRLGWGQVFDRPCATAMAVGQLLQQRGWTGNVTTCGTDCLRPAA